jgi:hypothetical protein
MNLALFFGDAYYKQAQSPKNFITNTPMNMEKTCNKSYTCSFFVYDKNNLIFS